MLVATTSTPGTKAPEGSFTFPRIVAVVDWPHAAAQASIRYRPAQMARTCSGFLIASSSSELLDRVADSAEAVETHLRVLSRNHNSLHAGAESLAHRFADGGARGLPHRGGFLLVQIIRLDWNVDVDAAPHGSAGAAHALHRPLRFAVYVIGANRPTAQFAVRHTRITEHPVVELEQFPGGHVPIDRLADAIDVSGHARPAAVVVQGYLEK